MVTYITYLLRGCYIDSITHSVGWKESSETTNQTQYHLVDKPGFVSLHCISLLYAKIKVLRYVSPKKNGPLQVLFNPPPHRSWVLIAGARMLHLTPLKDLLPIPLWAVLHRGVDGHGLCGNTTAMVAGEKAQDSSS